MRQLSGLDASFLYLETAEMPMHVGALSVYELPRATAATLPPSCARTSPRLPLVPALRRKLAWMPLNLAAPAWVDAEPDMEEHIVGIRPKADSGAGRAGEARRRIASGAARPQPPAVEVPRLRRPRARAGTAASAWRCIPSCTMPRSTARRRWRWRRPSSTSAPAARDRSAHHAAPQELGTTAMLRGALAHQPGSSAVWSRPARRRWERLQSTAAAPAAPPKRRRAVGASERRRSAEEERHNLARAAHAAECDDLRHARLRRRQPAAGRGQPGRQPPMSLNDAGAVRDRRRCAALRSTGAAAQVAGGGGADLAARQGDTEANNQASMIADQPRHAAGRSGARWPCASRPALR